MEIIAEFSKLKRETKIIIIGCILLILTVIFFSIKLYLSERQLNKELKSQLNELQKTEQTYVKDIKGIKNDLNDLKNESNKKVSEYEALIDKLKNQKNDGKKIPDIVKSYPDGKLDSILANYKHPKRAEN